MSLVSVAESRAVDPKTESLVTPYFDYSCDLSWDKRSSAIFLFITESRNRIFGVYQEMKIRALKPIDTRTLNPRATHRITG